MVPFHDRHAPVQFFRIRLTLEMADRVHLHAHHAGMIYALLAAANASGGGPAAVPDGLMPDVPEQCRVLLEPGDPYAFGFTLIAPGVEQAGSIVWRIVRGLRQLGAQHSSNGAKLAGNFRVASVEDLVSGRKLADDEEPSPILQLSLDEQIEKVRATTNLTLRFTSPLRHKRPSSDRTPGHIYFDSACFDPPTFLSRLDRRLENLGFSAAAECIAPSAVRVLENGLVWLDLAYGPLTLRKTLGGAVGRVRLRVSDSDAAPLLVWGQYTRTGENTRFGFGCYTIEELGPDPYECRRSCGLVPCCFASPELDTRAAELDVPSGAAREAIQLISQGRYKPAPCIPLTIHEPPHRPRQLAIPVRLDRALQRVVVDRLGPALDLFFEESSMAYRKGLGRGKAAARIRSAFRRGFRYALRTDFTRFFDTIDHNLLQRRLEAYVADGDMVRLIMAWVQKGAPEPGRGLPTGSPLSPMLSNLFLDTFDEQIAATGAFLVRYADDFLMLFKNEQEAARAQQTAQRIAEQLLLTLNEAKTLHVDLREPFEFLGYRFERRHRWQILGDNPPRRIEDLGWYDNKPSLHQEDAGLSLPGEQEQVPAAGESAVIFGPGAAMLKTMDGRLVCSYVDGRGEASVELASAGVVILLGRATITGTAAHQLIESDIPILLANDSGAVAGTLTGASDLENPQAVAGQVLMAQNEQGRLAIVRTLIGAKLRNYAALARSLQAGSAEASLGETLTELASRLPQANSIDEAMGIEGAGAARWYGTLDKFRPGGFHFERRVAPDAKDPINVMLNMAHTLLYRQMMLVARQAGMVPSLGIMHTPRPGYAALACDLQEPFRHLMDLAVLLAARRIDPKDFTKASKGPFALEIRPQAARQLYATIWTVLARHCQSRHGGEVRSYLMWMTAAARALRRHLCDSAQAFEVFEHPS